MMTSVAKHRMSFGHAPARARLFILFLAFSLSPALGSAQIKILEFQPDVPVCRAKRLITLYLTLGNDGDRDEQGTVELHLPPVVELIKGNRNTPFAFRDGAGELTLSWTVQASQEGRHELAVEVKPVSGSPVRQTLNLLFLPSVTIEKADRIPDPQPVATDILVGAHHCPLWEKDRPEIWRNVIRHPERTPALGFYCQEQPEVADWETKWAVEHGISFFVYCWYRASQGGPVETRLSSAIHEALFHSRFQDKIRFAIMWENQRRGVAGIANEEDFLQNLLPYWIENYFRRPNYLIIDRKPLLFIYRPEYLIQDLGSVEKVAQAFAKARELCRQAGFDGIYLLGEYRGTNPKHLQLMKDLGLDYTFAYVWPVPNNPSPEEAIRAQLDYIKKTQELNILPQVITVSQGWSGWRDEGSIWKLPPEDFERLMREAKAFAKTLPPEQLGSRIILLDNWNEWGEGHYIGPHREFGFGYLDAVRRVFAGNAATHLDLLPEDIGLGPYDLPIRAYYQRERESRQKARTWVKPIVSDEALVAYWTFDENKDEVAAFDYSGHRLGGILHQIERVKGWRGTALDCRGGSMIVPTDERLSDWAQMSVECWIRTDQPDQDNRWIINRVFGGAETSGFRLGILRGRPSFQIPVTAWSHHLVGKEPLPQGRWVHIAGTFDGTTMRLYMDGHEVGRMERSGSVRNNNRPIVVGNYDVDHAAHFVGELDEVRLYSRVLTPEEIASRAAQPAEK
ncbi:MAG: LamG-like jellyroll fold domain-containing protein [Thermogutta sp.]